MMRRLAAQIHVGFLGIIFACLLIAALSMRLVHDDRGEVPEAVAAGAAFITADLPAGDALQPALLARAEELRLHLALWDTSGALIATTLEELPGPHPDCDRMGWIHTSNGPGLRVQLSDGRWLSATLEDTTHSRFPRHLLLLVVLMVVLGIGSRGIAGRITGRLERLQRGVESWGEGDLSVRMAVEGHDEVAALAGSFNHTADRIETLVSSQRRMLASASHELRSPLARLRMAVEILGEDGPDRARWRTEAETDIAELDALIGDLLLASRLESAAPGERTEVDLLDLLMEEGARVDAVVSGAAVQVRGDPRMLRRMLRNLLENARRHGGGEIEASVAPVSDGVRIAVCDRGAGVAPGERERIFEPFYRPEGHREGADGGVGLGLALVRRIAAHHGGTARCIDRLGGGSCFEVTLAAEVGNNRAPPGV